MHRNGIYFVLVWPKIKELNPLNDISSFFGIKLYLTFYIPFYAYRLDLQNGIRFVGSKTGI